MANNNQPIHTFSTDYKDNLIYGYNEPVAPYKCALCGKISTERNNCFIGKNHYCGILCYQRAKKIWRAEQERLELQQKEIEKRQRNLKKRLGYIPRDEYDDKYCLTVPHLRKKGYDCWYNICAIYSEDDEDYILFRTLDFREAHKVAGEVFHQKDTTEPKERNFEVWVEIDVVKDGKTDRGITNLWNEEHIYYKRRRYDDKELG